MKPPDLAEVLVAHRWESRPTKPGMRGCYYCGKCKLEFKSLSEHEAHQAQAWREACTITTVEQLGALPVFSAVLPMWYSEIVCFRYSDGWYVPLSDTPVYPLGDTSSEKACLLIWHPEWAR